MATAKLQSNQNFREYLNQDKSINVRKHLEEQKKTKESGLEGIEIRKKPKQLGKNDFLKLLVKQLTHQDPTAPMKDQQFIAQMAQFSSLEQMNNISQGMNRMAQQQAMQLVGKFVVGKDQNGNVRSGVAQALYIDGENKTFLKVGKYALASDKLKLVGNPDAFKSSVGGQNHVPTRKNGKDPVVSPASPAGVPETNAPLTPDINTAPGKKPELKKNVPLDSHTNNAPGKPVKPAEDKGAYIMEEFIPGRIPLENKIGFGNTNSGIKA